MISKEIKCDTAIAYENFYRLYCPVKKKDPLLRALRDAAKRSGITERMILRSTSRLKNRLGNTERRIQSISSKNPVYAGGIKLADEQLLRLAETSSWPIAVERALEAARKKHKR